MQNNYGVVDVSKRHLIYMDFADRRLMTNNKWCVIEREDDNTKFKLYEPVQDAIADEYHVTSYSNLCDLLDAIG